MRSIVPARKYPHEYDLSQPHGYLKLHKQMEEDLDELKNIVMPEDEDKTAGYAPVLHNIEIIKKCLCKDDHIETYGLLHAIQKNGSDGIMWIKAALQNKTTNKVALITVINQKPIERSSPSQVEGWFVYRSRMVAPICFWDAFKAC
jgi:hypothetical protein